MYCAFYGISEKPFSITPDPKFLFLGATHKEAFAHLVYGIRERGGFITITGEIGTGKTTLCRALLSHLDSDTLVAFVFNPTLSAIELLKSINEDFGIPSRGNTRKDLIDELNRFLLEKRKEGKNTVLIIDEAQNLDQEVLEHIRLLSNLETDTEKLLQIILIGQPEFRKILAQPNLQQLNQRVTVRYHLQPLSKEETEGYVLHRLSVVGAGDKIRFTSQALKKIYRYTDGVPRLINVLCDRCLLAGYSLGRKEIDVVIVDRAHREVACGGEPEGALSILGFLQRGLLPGFLLAAFILVVAYGMYSFTSGRPAVPPISKVGDRPSESGKKRDLGTLVLRPEPGAEAPVAEVRKENGLAGASPSEALVRAADDGTAPGAGPAAPEAAKAGIEVLPGVSRRPAESPVGSMEEILVRSLTEQTVLETRKEALAAVLSRWGLLAGDRREQERFLGLDIYQAARAFGLRCARFRGNLNRIRALNVPVILEMTVGGNPPRRYVALTGLDESKARIAPALRDGSETVPAEVLEKFWYGTAYVLWKDESGGGLFLTEGMQGVQVRWLQESLRHLGYYQGRTTGMFDPSTVRAVCAFQAAHYLEEDGILGPQTRILLFHVLGTPAMPALSGSS